MEGAPLRVWVISDSIFSGYPQSKGMPFALQQLQLNPDLTRTVRPIELVGTLTPGSSETWVMNSPRTNALNGATSADLDTATNGYLASIGEIDIMILQAGINDIIAGTPTATIISHLQSIIDKFNASSNKTADAKVYVVNRIPPLNAIYDAAVDELNAGILTLTGTDGFVDEFTGWVPATMTIAGDGHPSFPATWTITPDYSYGVWYQAKLVFQKIFGHNPGV